MPSSLLASFSGALQASLSVLLTIFYGVIAAQFQLLSESSTKDISKTCVRLFLPALLIVSVGSDLDSETVFRYVPLLVWSIVYNVLSMAFGLFITRTCQLPNWVTPAIAFNNTTSLPLLLVGSLDATGILNSILMSSDDSTSAAVHRAKSYFLVNAMVSNTLTFALGPRLLNGQEEDAPKDSREQDKKEDEEEGGEDGGLANGNAEHGSPQSVESAEEPANEQTSLLPDTVVRHGQRASDHGYKKFRGRFEQLPEWMQNVLDITYQFFNAPLVGAVIGAFIGLVSPLHRAFFAPSTSGGILTAWLTASIKNVGDLFAALQVIVVGVKLGASLRRLKAGEPSGAVPWLPVILVTIMRFVVWPALSIGLIWALAAKTSWLSDDPILWFSLMLMPTGPPALKLSALAEVNGSDQMQQLAIAKFLSISYAISPLICFSVVGSLKASEAAMGR